jgi:hypothetical protein
MDKEPLLPKINPFHLFCNIACSSADVNKKMAKIVGVQLAVGEYLNKFGDSTSVKRHEIRTSN